MLFKNLVILVVLKLPGPTTADCSLDVRSFKLDISGILGRPGKVKSKAPSVALEINY